MSDLPVQACDDIVDLIKAAPFAATFVSRVKRVWMPIKDLAALKPGEIHVSVIPPISVETESSGRGMERHLFAAQVVVEGKLISSTQLSDEWNQDCDRFAATMRDVLLLLREQTELAHGAKRHGPARTIYNFSPNSLRQNCWSSAWAIPLSVEESRR